MKHLERLFTGILVLGLFVMISRGIDWLVQSGYWKQALLVAVVLCTAYVWGYLVTRGYND
jgi:hypothetical protein